MDIQDNLSTFRQLVHEYRTAPHGDGQRHSQEELASAVGLDPTELSNRLNRTKRARLTCANVRAIVRTLAEWRKISSQAQASFLVDLMGCSFTPADWSAAPLEDLKSTDGANTLLEAPQALDGHNGRHALTLSRRRGAAHHRVRLPVPLSTLIDREHDAAAVAALLLHDGTRLVSLTGPGGVGKTRLALHVAAQHLDDFEDDVICVNLDNIADPEHVLAAIARGVGIAYTDQDVLDVLISYCEAKHALLLLDTFERVISAGVLVVELLQACPRLHVLVTSRQALEVRGEKIFHVSALALPDLTRLPPLEALKRVPSIALFLERTREVSPEFALLAENAAAIAALCVRLDGLPLAIELASRHMQFVSPEALLHQLSCGTPLQLEWNIRDLPPRQQALRTLIEWSYNLLSPAEQLLFVRLAIFAESFTVEAVQAVCDAGDLPFDVQHGLSTLVCKNLLFKTKPAQSATRFAMLGTIREYALEQLRLGGEEPPLRRALVHYYITLAEAVTPDLRTAEQFMHLRQLDREQVNLNSAFQSVLEHGEAELACALAAALRWYWAAHGYWRRGLQWLEAALVQSTEGAVLTRARAVLAAGYFVVSLGDQLRAKALLEESLTLFQELEDSCGIAEALLYLGHIAHMQHNYTEAVTLLEQSLTRFQNLKERWFTATVLMNLGEVLYDEGKTMTAEEHFQTARELYQGVEYLSGVVSTLPDLFV